MSGSGLTFAPVTDAELPAYLAALGEGYVDQMVDFGRMAESVAHEKAAGDMAKLFPGGALSPGHEIVLARNADGRRVGGLWLELRGEGEARTAWVYDITIEEFERGRGYGRALMNWAIDRARAAGAVELQLNVFAGNTIARALYSDLGFIESAVTMNLTL